MDDPLDYAIERYERAIEFQVDRQHNFTTRALRLSQFVFVVLGVLATGLAATLRVDGVDLADPILPFVTILGGAVFLVAALGFSVAATRAQVLYYGALGNVEESAAIETAVNDTTVEDLDLLDGWPENPTIADYYETFSGELVAEDALKGLLVDFRHNQTQMARNVRMLKRPLISLLFGSGLTLVGLVTAMLESWADRLWVAAVLSVITVALAAWVRKRHSEVEPEDL